ncbi:hypothetical protein [Candidatus Albibeggiatoa sp. nov. NOAA]|uniref:hypothetical protein n=1 Tax=Candidatus Albibeggiatoa sp. nov. NOAA TaxID=3162724 RepID=UPI0032F5A942|nr:hypothetical protein [Thiotrichaceae bacterium]
MSESDIQQRVAAAQTSGQAVCDAMRATLEKEGFADGQKRIGDFAVAAFEIVKDPFDGSESLKGMWDGQNGGHGSIMLYPDGKVYAEVDVIQIHPNKPKWFVEGVTAWGHIDKLKTELKLLPAL